MKRVYVFLTFVFSLLLEAAAIEPVMVTENTFKLNGEETLYYGFASGDQIIFDFSETSGKEVKEVEIVEMPSNTKFQDFKTSGVSNKTIKVVKKGLYAFRFKNPAIAKRICKVKIQRIPADESKISFDTGWRYEEVKDTTVIPYTEDSIVGYDEQQYTEVVRELVKTEYETSKVLELSTELRSEGIINHDNPRGIYKLNLPSPLKEPLVEKSVVRWTLWLATGPDAQTSWQQNVQRYDKQDVDRGVVKTVIEIGTTAATKDPQKGKLAGESFDIVFPKNGSLVEYSIANAKNANLFYNGQSWVNLDHANVLGLDKMFTEERFMRDDLYLCLRNTNVHYRMKVVAKATALIEIKTFQNVEYKRVRSVPKTVTLNKTRLDIKTRQVMMMNGEE